MKSKPRTKSKGNNEKNETHYILFSCNAWSRTFASDFPKAASTWRALGGKAG